MKTYIFKTPLVCNKVCDFCVTNASYSEKRYYFPIKKFIKTCSVLKKYGYTKMSIEGGEPTMILNLVDLVKVAIKLGFETSIITNGSYADYDTLISLKKAGISNITYSLHSHLANIHDSLVGKKGSYDAMIESIMFAGEIGIDISTNTVICKDNHNDIAVIIDYIYSLGVRNISFCCLELAVQNSEEFEKKKFLLPNLQAIKKSLSEIKDKSDCDIKIDNLPFCMFDDKSIIYSSKYNLLLKGELVGLHEKNKNSKKMKIKSQECESCFYNNHCDGLLSYFPINHIKAHGEF